MTNNTLIAALAAAALLAFAAQADTIVTKDGSTLNGKIVSTDDGQVVFDTGFAGRIVIPQAAIESLSTDEPIYVMVEDGSTYLGPVSGEGPTLSVATPDGEITTRVDSVEETWLPGAKSPSQQQRETEIEASRRKWSFEAAFDLAGKSGNSTSTGMTSHFRAELDGPIDTLRFVASANYEKSEDTLTANDLMGGVEYTSMITDHLNWYVRTELGRDEIKDIEIYSTTAGGLGYTFVDTERRHLDLRAGLGYRFEAYEDTAVFDEDGNLVSLTPRENTSTASLDFGLLHEETFAWGQLVNRLTYTPSIEDFANYRIAQESSLMIPLKIEGWSTRIGIANQYDSQAELSGKKELDTTYFVRLVLAWE